jgi:hypothetical protein
MNDTIETSETEPVLETDAKESTEPTASASPEATPRVRVGAIAWGLVVCVIAATVLAIVTDTARSVAVANWFGEITIGNIWMIALIFVGALTLLIGTASLIGQAQRSRRR